MIFSDVFRTQVFHNWLLVPTPADCVNERPMMRSSPPGSTEREGNLEFIFFKAGCYLRSVTTILGTQLLGQRFCPPLHLPHSPQELVVYLINMSTAFEKQSPKVRHVTQQKDGTSAVLAPGRGGDTPQALQQQPCLFPLPLLLL